MRGRALDHPGDEGSALIVGLREHADPRIGHLARRENAFEAPTAQRIGENIGELVIGRILLRVVMRVRRAELRQHRIDDDGRIFRGARGSDLWAVTRTHRLPVYAVQARVIEAVAHGFPDFIEGRQLRYARRRLRLVLHLSPCRPCAEGSRGRERQQISTRCFHEIQAPAHPERHPSVSDANWEWLFLAWEQVLLLHRPRQGSAGQPGDDGDQSGFKRRDHGRDPEHQFSQQRQSRCDEQQRRRDARPEVDRRLAARHPRRRQQARVQPKPTPAAPGASRISRESSTAACLCLTASR